MFDPLRVTEAFTSFNPLASKQAGKLVSALEFSSSECQPRVQGGVRDLDIYDPIYGGG